MPSQVTTPAAGGFEEAEVRLLWQRIAAHPFEQPEQATDFTRRLAREQGWSLAQARAAVEEYRRFCFLQAVQPSPLTPSDAVDQVWHLHLTHSRDYWEVWCAQVLQQPLHHHPGSGGRAQRLRHNQQYAHTLALYESFFGLPPLAWWPAMHSQAARAPRWQWVDRRRVWVLRRPSLPRLYWRRLLAAFGLLALPTLTLALDLNPLDWRGEDFLLLYGIGLVVAWIIGRILLHTGANTGHPAVPAESLSPLQAAFLAGGAQRVIDASVTEALTTGVVELAPSKRQLVLGQARPRTEQLELAKAAAVPGGVALSALPKALLPLVDRVRAGLVQRGLVLDRGPAAGIAWRAALPMWLWLGFGGVKVVIGLDRGRAVGFLVMLCVLACVLALRRSLSRPALTAAGKQSLRVLRTQYQRVQRAPQTHELAWSVALLGTAALAGSAHADFHLARQPVGSSGSSSGSDGSSSSDSGGGDSGGGSGCGGCGGGGGD